MDNKCCFCGNDCGEWGNNPWPANTDEDAKCCDACNNMIVLPARLSQMFGGANGKSKS